MFSATDWAVKRLLKIVLKRNLGRVFEGDVDLDQLDVQLGKGTLELRSLLLNCGHLNQHLAHTNWELVTGYVGRVSAVIPFTTLHTDPCTAELDEVLLKLRYNDAIIDHTSCSPPDVEKVSSEGNLAEYDDKYLAHTAISDGVRLIAGGIDNLLHQLQLKASRITAYLEFPSVAAGEPGAIMVLTLDDFQFSSQDVFQPTRQGDQQLLQTQLNKSVSFEGLSIEMCTSVDMLPDLPSNRSKDHNRPFATHLSFIDETEESLQLSQAQRTTILCNNEGLGCSGRFSVQLKSIDNLKPHHVSVDVNLDPFQVQLHSDQLTCLATLAKSLVPCQKPPQSAESVSKPEDVTPEGSRSFVLSSFFQGFSLPDVEGFVSDALKMGAPGSPSQLLGKDRIGTQSAIEEFFDCSSVLGSVRNGISSVLSRQNSTQTFEIGAEPSSNKTETEILIQTSELSVVLWYPRGGCQAPQPAIYSDLHMHGRLALECSDVCVRLKLSDQQTAVSVSLHRLEAAEYLTSSVGNVHSANQAIAEFANAPDRLPPAAGARPTLSFCGVAMQPSTAHSMYNSTLSHLSCMSCSWTEAAAGDPRVQVWPVLAMSALRPRADLPFVPSVSVTLSITQSGLTSTTTGAKLDVNLRPATVWLSAPLLDRLVQYCQPLVDLSSSQKTPVPAAPSSPPVLRHESSKVAVEQAIHSILDDLQEFREERGLSRSSARSSTAATTWEMNVQAPQVCVVLAIPPGPNDAAPHLYSSARYLAVDVYPPSYRLAGATKQTPVLSAQYPGSSYTEGGAAPASTRASTWQSQVALGRVQLFMLTSLDGLSSLSSSTDNPLQVNCVVDISCGGPQTVGDGPGQVPLGVALQAELQYRGGTLAERHLVDTVWDHADMHAGKNTANLDGSGVWSDKPGQSGESLVSIQDQCVSSSSSVVTLTLPNLHAELSQADFAVLWHVLDSYLRLSQRRLEAYQALRSGEMAQDEQSQATVLVHCGGNIVLIGNNQVNATGSVLDPLCYSLDLNSAELMSVSCLGGLAEAAVLMATAKGLVLRGGRGGDRATLLCLPDHERSAAMDLVQITRPRGMAQSFMMGDPSAFSVFTESLVSLKCVGANVAADQDSLTLPWVAALGQFFDTGAPPAAVEKPPSPVTEVVVHLQDSAFLLETPSAHSALLLGEVAWQQPAGSHGSSSLALQCLAVFAAPMAVTTRPADVHCAASRVKLLQSGYSCLAEDGEIRAQVAQSEQDGGGLDVNVSNQRLCSCITQSSLKLLKQLIGDITSTFTATRTAPPSPESTGVMGSACSPSDGDHSLHDMVQLFQHLKEDAFRREDREARDVDASVFLGAGWYDDAACEEVGSATSASSSPLLIEDFLAVTPMGCWFAEEDWQPEGVGGWYTEAAEPLLALQEDYVKVPASESGGVSVQRCSIGTLPSGYPRPITRFIARNMRCSLKLARNDKPGSASDATDYVEIDIDRVCCQYDVFGPSSQCAMRLSVAVHNLEVHDCQSNDGSGGKLAGSRRRTLGHHSLNKIPTNGNSTLFNLLLEAVRPDPSSVPANQELRLHIGLMPLKLDLDQSVVLFLQEFFSSPVSDGKAPPAPAAAQPGDDTTFFQRCEIEGFNLLLDYRPRKFDVAALRSGNLAEVLNIFPWGGVDLQLKRLKLFGLHGWSSLATAIATSWLEDIAKSQIHKFVAGIGPIRSLSRVSSAALQLISIPAEQFFRDSFPGASNQSVSWQLRRGIMKFMRAVMLEGMGVGANLAAGAQMVWQGRMGSLDNSKGTCDPRQAPGGYAARPASSTVPIFRSSSYPASHCRAPGSSAVADDAISRTSSSTEGVRYPTLFGTTATQDADWSNPWDGKQ